MANKGIFFGVCVDNQDPSLAGRIRAVFDESWEGSTPTDYDTQALEGLLNPNRPKNSERIAKYGEGEQGLKNLKWSQDDPHLCAPFLPAFINVIPQSNESVKIIVYDPDNKTQNKEYIGPQISKPTSYNYDQYAKGRLHTSKGARVKAGKNITDSAISNDTFAYPDKISIDGRDNSDIIFGNSEILMRAGKFVENDKDPDFPVYNPQMSAIQITNYPSKMTLEEKEITDNKTEEVAIKYLVEYEINDLNPIPPAIGFDGKIVLYEIVADGNTNKLPTSTGMGLGTPIDNTKKRVSLSFGRQSLSGATDLINEFLSQVDGRDDTSLKTGPFQDTNTPPLWFKAAGTGDDIINVGTVASNDDALNLYPFYFRPSISFQDTISLVNPNDSALIDETKKRNAQYFTNHIRLVGVNGDKHYGLKISRDQAEPETKTETTKIDEAKLDESRREGIINAISNKILLYSHDSSITDKEKSNPLVENTNVGESGDNMGLDQKTQITLNDKEMEPLVRGEELVKVLQLMAQYLFKHEHKSPGDPPLNKTKEGPTAEEVDKALGAKNFLNQNIRIN